MTRGPEIQRESEIPRKRPRKWRTNTQGGGTDQKKDGRRDPRRDRWSRTNPFPPGFCIKTNSAEGKVFINICHSPSIPPPADLTEDELLQMLEEDQAGFRIPMSLGEPHAELDASQCLEKTQESTPHPHPHDPFLPRTKDSRTQGHPPSEPRNLFPCDPNPLSDPFPQGISPTSRVSTVSLGSPGSTHSTRLALLHASPQERVGLGRCSLADLTLVLGQLSLTPVFSCTFLPCLYVSALSHLC